MTRPLSPDPLDGVGGIDRADGEPAVLAERYELTGRLGEGGMAEVFRAWDRLLEREVAVKILPAERRGDDTDTRRLQDEARAAAALNHPHVVTVFDVGASPRGTYIVMELLSGRTWLDELRARGPLPESEVLRVGAATADALAASHARGVVHRDVKPANVMLQAGGTVTLTDFGVARRAGAGGLTETGQVVGTASCMAPEQVRGEPVDGRSDVYSLGCTLYEALTGRAPFVGSGAAAVAAARLNQAPEPPRHLRPDVSVATEELVMRALSLRAEDRPDAAALATALGEVGAERRDDGATAVLGRRDVPGDDPGEDGTDPVPLEPARSGSGLRRIGTVLILLGLVALAVAVVWLSVR